VRCLTHLECRRQISSSDDNLEMQFIPPVLVAKAPVELRILAPFRVFSVLAVMHYAQRSPGRLLGPHSALYGGEHFINGLDDDGMLREDAKNE
jgi:hypothetical protein